MVSERKCSKKTKTCWKNSGANSKEFLKVKGRTIWINKIMIIGFWPTEYPSPYRYKLINRGQGWQEGNDTDFHYKRVQEINVERKGKTENHYEANTTVITVADNIHQWLLKSGGESLRRNYLHSLKVCPLRYVSITKRKIVTL